MFSDDSAPAPAPPVRRRGRPRRAAVSPPHEATSAVAPSRDAGEFTPAMRQYREQKAQVGDAILLFRMGDFYELFYDDAVLGSRLLGLTLTSRDNGKTPLAGIPHHALDGYLAKLVAAGRKVAISEQMQDAAVARGVIERQVVRIVTPGTITDDALLESTRSNVLAALCRAAGAVGIASLELSSGLFHVQSVDERGALDELCRLGPAEVLLPDAADVGPDPLDADLRQRLESTVTYRPPSDFSPRRAQQLLEEQFEVRGLEGFGFRAIDEGLRAAGALVAYARETQKAAIRHLRPPRRIDHGRFLSLDATTLRSLEIEQTLRSGAREGSLLAAVDATVNPMGARLLRRWLCYPLRDPIEIERRLRLVDALREAGRGPIAALLREIGDIERMVGRLGVQRTHPRDLRGLGDGLRRLAPLRDELRSLRLDEADRAADQLEGLDALAAELCAALRVDAPLTLREGDIFAAGYDEELDRLRQIGVSGQAWLADFQAREAQRTGIPTLRVAFNSVFGYYIEITHPHRDRVPSEYVRRQTVKNAERYTTDELKRFEDEVLSARSRANELEYRLFCALRERVAALIPRLSQACATLAEIDVVTGWAELSIRRRYCRPEFVDLPVLEIDDGRHPVIEQLLPDRFVANDTRLAARDRGRPPTDSSAAGQGSGPPFDPSPASAAEEAPPCLALITGPNMAGKSTYIRQVALLTLLAHCGCFVPARRMRLGACDRIFTRVGAADELARGQSTFMVEMLETANILNNATPRSLVILDEIGRGTSTYDGLSLAWAIAENLAATVGCRTLFATHYHELTELAEILDGVANRNVAVKEYEDQIIFLHRIVPGAADRSYGLHVAKLAGLPRGVLERANAVLNELERTFARESHRPVLAAAQRRRQRQLRLFEEPEEAIIRELRSAPADLGSAEALELIARWRRTLPGEPGGRGAPPSDASPRPADLV